MDEQTYALATKAAWYYYMEDNTQAQIAEVMGVSRAKVIRLLEEARAQGIVQFSFRKNDSQRVSFGYAGNRFNYLCSFFCVVHQVSYKTVLSQPCCVYFPLCNQRYCM